MNAGTPSHPNQEALERIQQARPCLVDLQPASKAIPWLQGRRLLHAGPPMTWARMSGPVQGAVIGAAIYEEWAKDPDDARALAASGGIEFAPCHHHRAVGPMAGVVSPSMPVYVVRNETAGNPAHCTINEGLGKVLRFGAYDAEVLARLRWIRDELAPVLARAIRAAAPLDLKAITAQALQMGDECHNRNKAASKLVLAALAPHLARAGAPAELAARVFEFITGNDHFYLNLSMPACKATLDAAHGIPGCTLVTAMARNGTEFGIRVSGLGEAWCTAPAEVPAGLYFPGYSQADANPDLGDSAITETAGLGGFAMAAAPAIVQFVGGDAALALNATREMYEITVGESRDYRIPALDFRGTPVGIDVRKVVETGILPVINTGIAHRQAGVGQIGAGLARAPLACFIQALERLTRSDGR